MANSWFETVAEAQRRAKKRLPSSVYSALLAGSEKGVSYADNTQAFSELGLAPHVAGLHSQRDLATNVMGQDISMPVFISPTGVQAVHPEGELAVARAAEARGTAVSLGSFGSKTLEAVIAQNPKTFFQMYWMGTRDAMLQRIEKARVDGAKGLILTLDWSFTYGRDWGSPVIPEKVDLKTMVQFAPQVITKPRWLLEFARNGGIPDLTTPNLVDEAGVSPTFFGAYFEWMQTPPATWADIAWLRSQWDGPFMLKGICRVDDAKAAVQAGFTAISVSNHGGNNIDTTPAPIRVLPSIVAAVGNDVEVVMDGGIRRGSDVVKAVALGARSVMIGRAYLWALAANGQAGVENVLDILRNGIDATLYGLGHSSIHDLSPEDVVMPAGFTRTLGA
ncbi:MAG: mycofactocin biosynthesis FMN-dependent deaminase MftD [Candidatus Nanopelagicales bacterium]|jgi:pre-mycofactocin synthase|nr:mycofactocin biosynthesis FMN-dependent deaminase MftD [Candidatus Nanopelagicales bacterium]